MAILSGLLAFCFAAHTFAKTSDKTIIVTASRSAQTTDETLSSVTVISREDIERSQIQTLPLLLTTIAGVYVTQSGGNGSEANVYVRGTAADHVLVMVDGIKIGSATLGTVPFQDIPLEHVERIEIIRGPRSSLYGSEAIGGIIQIFTRKSNAENKAQAKAMIGTHGSRGISSTFSGATNANPYNISLSHFSTDGIDAALENDRDKDGYRRYAASTSLKHGFDNASDISFNFLHASGRSEYDGSMNNQVEFKRQVAGLVFHAAPLELLDSKFHIGLSRDYSDYFNNTSPDTSFHTTRSYTSWVNSLALSDHQQLIAGIDYQHDDLGSNATYSKTSRANTGVFIQHQIDLETHDILIGLRKDQNEQFGGHVTGNFAYGKTLIKDLRIYLNIGSAFKAPTFNELYWPGANPDLSPETSISYEVGIRDKWRLGSFALNFYKTKIDDLINWACSINCGDTDWTNDVWLPTNVETADIRGIEFDLTSMHKGWLGVFNVSLIDARNANTNKALAHRSGGKTNLGLERTIGGLHIRLDCLAQSHSYNDRDNAVRLPGYGLINFSAQYEINNNLKVQTKIENILDKKHTTVADFNSPGRASYISISYQST
jgi:vitamin B12 transporter